VVSTSVDGAAVAAGSSLPAEQAQTSAAAAHTVASLDEKRPGEIMRREFR
jgi:hypothetical protein